MKNSIKDAWTQYKADPQTNKDKLLKCVQSYKEFWVGERQKAHDKLWQQQLAFYSGDHYIRARGSQDSRFQVRLRENHTNNIVQRITSIIAQNMPIPRVFANSTSYEDVRNAETTEQYAKYYWRLKKLETMYAKKVKYCMVFGNAFTYRTWNPDLGGKMVMNPSDNLNGETQVAEFQGDIDIKIEDPFRWAVRPGIESMDDMYDIVHVTTASKDALEEKYGEIQADPAKIYDVYSQSQRVDDEQVAVNEYFHKPTPWFEEGLYVSWVGGQILEAKAYPYKDGKLPVTVLGFDRAPMRFWAMSPIEQVMDLQEQLNKAASMIIEARNLVARPRWLIAHEAQVPAQSISDRPGEVIRYKSQGAPPPQPVVPSFNFGELASHKADVRAAMEGVSGVTSASRGEIPAATRTALALQLVLEQDRSQFAPFIKEFHQNILDDVEGILGLAAQFFPEEDPRVIKVEGQGFTTTRTFHGGMVPSPLDVTLEDTNPLGWTAAGRAERVESLVQLGVLTDKNQILEMLKLNTSDTAYELLNANRTASQRENEVLKQGQYLSIGPADDHAVHIQEHDKIIASFSFRELPPAIQDMFVQHRQEHLDAMAQGQGGNAAPQEETVNTQQLPPEQLSAGLEAPSPGGALDELIQK